MKLHVHWETIDTLVTLKPDLAHTSALGVHDVEHEFSHVCELLMKTLNS